MRRENFVFLRCSVNGNGVRLATRTATVRSIPTVVKMKRTDAAGLAAVARSAMACFFNVSRRRPRRRSPETPRDAIIRSPASTRRAPQTVATSARYDTPPGHTASRLNPVENLRARTCRRRLPRPDGDPDPELRLRQGFSVRDVPRGRPGIGSKLSVTESGGWAGDTPQMRSQPDRIRQEAVDAAHQDTGGMSQRRWLEKAHAPPMPPVNTGDQDSPTLTQGLWRPRCAQRSDAYRAVATWRAAEASSRGRATALRTESATSIRSALPEHRAMDAKRGLRCVSPKALRPRPNKGLHGTIARLQDDVPEPDPPVCAGQRSHGGLVMAGG